MATEIIYKNSTGKVLTKNDLEGFSGTVSWEIASENTVSLKATKLHNKGREFGQKGEYKSSILQLELAAKEDPKWAYPVYDLAYTYMLMGDFEKAHGYYQKVDQMAPRGFFTVKTALYTLNGEKDGKFPKGLYMSYLSTEWLDVPKKIESLQNISQKLPKYAPVWKDLISFAANDEVAIKFIENGLSASPDAETYGILLINKALILHRSNRQKDALSILGELALDPTSSLGTEKLAKQTLAHLVNTKS
ncbi:MAG: hypothetical protein V4732_19115 [Pseudomonadota bacterium]